MGSVRGTKFELIETLWNVNSFLHKIMPPHLHELIETLWNVNTISNFMETSFKRINRNIVECK